jgi:hypothetical protein
MDLVGWCAYPTYAKSSYLFYLCFTFHTSFYTYAKAFSPASAPRGCTLNHTHYFLHWPPPAANTLCLQHTPRRPRRRRRPQSPARPGPRRGRWRLHRASAEGCAVCIGPAPPGYATTATCCAIGATILNTLHGQTAALPSPPWTLLLRLGPGAFGIEVSPPWPIASWVVVCAVANGRSPAKSPVPPCAGLFPDGVGPFQTWYAAVF